MENENESLNGAVVDNTRTFTVLVYPWTGRYNNYISVDVTNQINIYTHEHYFEVEDQNLEYMVVSRDLAEGIFRLCDRMNFDYQGDDDFLWVEVNARPFLIERVYEPDLER